MAVKNAAALEASSAVRTALPAAEAAGRGADAVARTGSATESTAGAALCTGKAGSDADRCGAALLADAMGAKVLGAALGLESSWKAPPATASAAKPATSHQPG